MDRLIDKEYNFNYFVLLFIYQFNFLTKKIKFKFVQIIFFFFFLIQVHDLQCMITSLPLYVSLYIITKFTYIYK